MNSKRIGKLRSDIIATLPKFPNDKTTKSELESKHLTDLLIDYLNWAARLILQRPREIIVEEEAIKDSRWHSLSVAFSSLQKRGRGQRLNTLLVVKGAGEGLHPSVSH